MTKIAELKATPRSDTGKEYARKLRAEGRIPAVLYGKDMEPVGLSLDIQETEYLFHRISVDNTIVDLVVEVGRPILLKKSSSRISVIITAIKMIMISSK